MPFLNENDEDTIANYKGLRPNQKILNYLSEGN